MSTDNDVMEGSMVTVTTRSGMTLHGSVIRVFGKEKQALVRLDNDHGLITSPFSTLTVDPHALIVYGGANHLVPV